jgi:hypothetical protein
VGSKVIRNVTKILKATSGRLFGRVTSGTGRAEELTPSEVRTLLELGTLATQSGTFSGTSSGTNTGDQNLFSTIVVSGQSNIVADGTSDSLTITAGTNISITTDASTDTLTIASTAAGLSGTGSVDNAALRADGTGGATLQNSNLEIADLFTASPNNTVNAVCVGPVGGTTNVDLVLKPKGSGAIQAHVADSTATGGNKRGANSVDLQTSRGNANQVASGAQSIIIGGDQNRASAQYAAVLGGFLNHASGVVSLAGGYGCSATSLEAFAFGYNCTASGIHSIALMNFASASGFDAMSFGYGTSAENTYAFAHGCYSVANKHGQRSQSSGRFAASGDAQISELVVRNATTNATQTELFLNGSSARITIANDTTWAFEAFIVARRTDADNESAAYKITGCIDRNTNAASTALVGTPTVTVISEDAAAWDVDAVADTTNGSLNFRVTGEAAKTIRWVGWVRLTEVTG